MWPLGAPSIHGKRGAINSCRWRHAWQCRLSCIAGAPYVAGRLPYGGAIHGRCWWKVIVVSYTYPNARNGSDATTHEFKLRAGRRVPCAHWCVNVVALSAHSTYPKAHVLLSGSGYRAFLSWSVELSSLDPTTPHPPYHVAAVAVSHFGACDTNDNIVAYSPQSTKAGYPRRQ